MKEQIFTQELFSKLSESVQEGDPDVGDRIKALMDKPEISFNQMRYLEGLLMILGEMPGEFEDRPDIEDDPEEYWEEY